ncbi:MAG TPA: hypothetical protein VFH64_10415 [Amnibacterium sp.]|nr:hypothetical protein [Amnibacterium sp.]
MAGRAVVPGADAPTAAEHGQNAGFYARALADPLFRARFRAAYTGQDDPLDALWWLDRPGETAPSGAPAPAAHAASARLALYGRGTDPAALERYEQAVAAAERSRRAAIAALGRTPVQGAAAPRSEAPPAHPDAAPVRGRRRRLLPVLAALVLLVLVAAAYGAGRVTGAPPSPPSLAEHFQQTVPGNRATAVFERAPEAADLLGGDLEPVDPVDLRRLVTLGSVRFLAARTRGDTPALCLIAAEGTDRIAARCVSAAEFDRAGVVLTPGDGLPSGFARVRWQPDGALVWWSPTD